MLETSPKLNLFYIQEVGVAGVQSGVLGLGAAEEWNVLTEKELVELERAQIFRASSHYRYLILSLSLSQVIRRFVRALLSLGVFWALLDPGLSDFLLSPVEPNKKAHQLLENLGPGIIGYLFFLTSSLLFGRAFGSGWGPVPALGPSKHQNENRNFELLDERSPHGLALLGLAHKVLVLAMAQILAAIDA